MLKVKTINNNKYFKIILLRLSLCLVHQCIRHVEIRTCTQNWVCVQIPTCAIQWYITTLDINGVLFFIVYIKS